jgi:uncharacterized membrane protein
MEYETQIFLLFTAATVGLLAGLAVILKERREAAATTESPFGVSTEGEKRCPHCGMGNLWTDRNCITCGKRLPG